MSLLLSPYLSNTYSQKSRQKVASSVEHCLQTLGEIKVGNVLDVKWV